MKISVIIPVRNGEKYVAQCIENVLLQTYKDLEIIVVNDGSTDRTAEIAAAFPGVRLIDNATNRGVATSRNVGIAAATGEYFHFMDVDDRINIDFYERMVAAAVLADADMAFCGFINEGNPHETLLFDHRWVAAEAEDKFSLSLSLSRQTRACVRTLGYSWRYLCRKKLIVEHSLTFPDGRLLEDIPFTVQAVYHANRIVTVPGAVYHYIKREGSALNSKDPEHARKFNEHYQMAMEFCDRFIAARGLKLKNTDVPQVFQYKLLGIPMLRKIVLDNGKTRWYLLGMRILQKKRL